MDWSPCCFTMDRNKGAESFHTVQRTQKRERPFHDEVCNDRERDYTAAVRHCRRDLRSTNEETVQRLSGCCCQAIAILPIIEFAEVRVTFANFPPPTRIVHVPVDGVIDR